MRNYRKAAVFAFLVLVLNLFAASIASACPDLESTHASHDDFCEGKEMSVIWETEEFLSWAKTSILSDSYEQLLGFTQRIENGEIRVFELAAFKEWLKSIDPNVATIAQRSAKIVKGSQLPATLSLRTRSVEGSVGESVNIAYEDSGSLFISENDQYVILPMASAWCGPCEKIRDILFEIFVERIVNEIEYRLKIFWNEIHYCTEGHIVHSGGYSTTTQCPYQPWCMGTWSRVLTGVGSSYGEFECQCGALWYVYP